MQPRDQPSAQKFLRKSDLGQVMADLLAGREPDPVALKTCELIAKSQASYDAQDWDACEGYIVELLKDRRMQQPLAYDAWGSCAQFQGHLDKALALFRKALAIDPEYVDARNRIIMIQDALPTTTAKKAQHERDQWWQKHGAAVYAKRLPHANSRDPDRPLRIGYVSGDFQYHSAATVFHRIAMHHSDGYVPYFYSTTPEKYLKDDSITHAYMAQPGWRDVRDWPAALVAGKVRDDQIDILVDLSGYTGCNQLAMFCHKPAPIQMTGWGYATGVGWPAMDYLISDRVVIPEDRQHEHVEKIAYLPCVIDYEPTQGLPDVNPLPSLTERPTFGVFQRSLKLNDEDIEVWRRILERLPESRLIMKSHYCDSLIRWMTTRFKDQVHQVEFRGATSSFDHKCQYAEVDICLDPWPQTGGVSACDALWMGVPAVTLIGPRVIQRTTASLLTILGLPDFITDTPEAYIEAAVSWVTTRKHELADIRAGLREKCDGSPIREGYREAAEAMYRTLWREWCAKPMTLTEAQYRLEQAS